MGLADQITETKRYVTNKIYKRKKNVSNYEYLDDTFAYKTLWRTLKRKLRKMARQSEISMSN
jgi:hypothetical protein